MAPFDDMGGMLGMMNMGFNPTDMAMLQRMQGSLPRINPGSYSQGYEIRRALRGGLVGPGVGTNRQMGSRGMGQGAISPFPGMGGGLDSSSITNPGIANSTLAPYGLQLPTHTNPFLFFNNQNQDGSPTWAGNHPRAAKAVEGAMIGMTTEGGNTLGQSISNVARTVLGIPGMYRQSQAAQMQAPFDMAHQMAALQDDQINQQLKLSQAFHLHATGVAALDREPPQKAIIPMTAQDGTVYGFDPNDNSMTPTSGAPKGDINKVGTTKPTPPGALPKWVGQNTNRQAAYFEYQAKGGVFDENGLPQDKMGFNNLVTKYTAKNAAAVGAGGTSGRKTTDLNLGGLTDQDKAVLTNLKDNVSKAEQESRERLDPLQFMGRPEGPVAAMNAERTKRQGALATAKKAYDDQVNNFKNPSNKTSSSPSPSTSRRVIDLTK